MSVDRFKPLLDKDFLKAELTYEFTDYKASGEDARLRDRLEAWSRRELKRETVCEVRLALLRRPKPKPVRIASNLFSVAAPLLLAVRSPVAETARSNRDRRCVPG